MKSILIIALSLFYIYSTRAQFLFENNNSTAKANLKVKTETGSYKMPDGSVCLMWIKKFNEQGLMTHFKDHWQCGKPYWTYDYEYNSSGVCIKSFKSSYKDNFKKIEMRHKFNSKAQTIERVAHDTIGYPAVEHFAYDGLGNIIKVTFSEPEKNGEKHRWSKSWNGDKTYAIQEVQEIRDEDKKLKWVVLREYEFYE